MLSRIKVGQDTYERFVEARIRLPTEWLPPLISLMLAMQAGSPQYITAT